MKTVTWKISEPPCLCRGGTALTLSIIPSFQMRKLKLIQVTSLAQHVSEGADIETPAAWFHLSARNPHCCTTSSSK